MPRWGEYDPGAWGWPVGDSQAFQPFSYQGHEFPQGIVVGHEPYWRRALDLLCGVETFKLPEDTGLAGGCWGQSTRRIAGTNRWSFHAYGLALDVAAPWNPSGSHWPKDHPYRLPINSGQLLRPLGIEWGGDWSSSPDWMHVESHLTPAEMADWLDHRTPTPGGRPFPLKAGYYFGPYSGPKESISGSGRQDARWRPYIAQAQRALGVESDGYYGPLTAAATVSWQISHQLVADGLIGPRTWESLGVGSV